MQLANTRRDALPGRGWHETEWRSVWRGALDPEFYEEPFETLSGYDVTLTFSDFGTLDRIPFDPAEQAGTFSSVWRDSITEQDLIRTAPGDGWGWEPLNPAGELCDCRGTLLVTRTGEEIVLRTKQPT